MGKFTRVGQVGGIVIMGILVTSRLVRQVLNKLVRQVLSIRVRQVLSKLEPSKQVRLVVSKLLVTSRLVKQGPSKRATQLASVLPTFQLGSILLSLSIYLQERIRCTYPRKPMGHTQFSIQQRSNQSQLSLLGL
jgi:hypothetical protein